jgi:hypothetical protein
VVLGSRDLDVDTPAGSTTMREAGEGVAPLRVLATPSAAPGPARGVSGPAPAGSGDLLAHARLVVRGMNGDDASTSSAAVPTVLCDPAMEVAAPPLHSSTEAASDLLAEARRLVLGTRTNQPLGGFTIEPGAGAASSSGAAAAEYAVSCSSNSYTKTAGSLQNSQTLAQARQAVLGRYSAATEAATATSLAGPSSSSGCHSEPWSPLQLSGRQPSSGGLQGHSSVVDSPRERGQWGRAAE